MKAFNPFSKKCPLSGKDAPEVSYKNVSLLQSYTSETGRIAPKRLTSVSSSKQRKLALEIKRARFLALLPFVIR